MLVDMIMPSDPGATGAVGRSTEPLLSPNQQRLLQHARGSWANSWLQTGVLVTVALKLLGLFAATVVFSRTPVGAAGLVVPAAVLAAYVFGWRRRNTFIFALAASGLAALDTVAFVAGPGWSIVPVMGVVQYAVAVAAWMACYRHASSAGAV